MCGIIPHNWYIRRSHTRLSGCVFYYWAIVLLPRYSIIIWMDQHGIPNLGRGMSLFWGPFSRHLKLFKGVHNNSPRDKPLRFRPDPTPLTDHLISDRFSLVRHSFCSFTESHWSRFYCSRPKEGARIECFFIEVYTLLRFAVSTAPICSSKFPAFDLGLSTIRSVFSL